MNASEKQTPTLPNSDDGKQTHGAETFFRKVLFAFDSYCAHADFFSLDAHAAHANVQRTETECRETRRHR